MFNLFLTKSFIECLCTWTNQEILHKGKYRATYSQLLAYIGLEISMSINQLNDIHDYWSSKMFLGNTDFQKVMSRDLFKNIRYSLKFYTEYDHSIAVMDTLWHSRIILIHFMKNSSSVAVPDGCSVLDENTIL